MSDFDKNDLVDMDKMEAHATSKFKHHKCALCDGHEWGISERVFRIADNVGITARSSYPAVFLTCANCGNTLIISAIVAGLQEKSDGNATSEGKPCE